MWKTIDGLRVNAAGALVLAAFSFGVLGTPGPDSPVADAAQRGDLELVRSLLSEGADVNAAQGDGMTALHWSALEGATEIVDVLLYAGASTEAITRLGAYTPLHLASRSGHAEVVTALLAGEANPDAIATTGVTPLHFAAAAGSAEAIRALVGHGANIDALETAKGQTPLIFAAAAGRLDAVNALIELGANYEIASNVVDFQARGEADGEDRRRRQELLVAIRKANGEEDAETPKGDEPATQNNRRDPNRTFQEDSRAKGQAAEGEEAAQAAAAEGQEAAQGEAAEGEAAGQERQGGEATGEQAAGEEAAEQAAAEEDAAAAAETADESEAEDEAADDEASDEDAAAEKDEDEEESREPAEERLGFTDLVGKQGGMTALHYAVRDGHADVVASLLAAGADIDERTGGDRSTPLVIAAINGHYDIGMYLLSQGADPNLMSEDGVAPLYATIANRWAPKALYPQPTAFKQQETSYLDFMRALLEAGADPDARVNTHIWYASYNFDLLGVNFRGATPFWRAAYALDVPAMRLLVSYGADSSIPTRKPPERRFRRRSSDDEDEEEEEDPSGLPPVEVGGPGIPPIVAAAGVGYGRARAGNSHRHAPDSWLAAAKYLIEELGADPNARDHDGFSALHYAAARGDNELILYLVEQGADPLVVARTGQTTVDMANGPIQRVQPFFETIELLEEMGAKNNHNCLSC